MAATYQATSQILLDLLASGQRDLGNDLVDILRQYNDNMLQYSATVNSLVSLIASRTRSASMASLFSNANTPNLNRRGDAGSNMGTGINVGGGPVVFSEAQVEAIMRDTETFVFRNTMSDGDDDGEGEEKTGDDVEMPAERQRTVPMCPITHEPFQDGETLMRIRRCRHTFKRAALMEWFGRSMSCPVCRGTV